MKFKSFKLNKEKRGKFIIYEVPSKELESDNDDLDKLISEKELSDILSEFKTTLESRFSKEELITFYNNIKTLRIEETDLAEINKDSKNKVDTLAVYKIADNIISLPDKNNANTMYHELFHMSNSLIKDTVVFSGFFQYDFANLTGVGEGINEGYTQILAERYFDKSSKGNYDYFIYIMLKLEKIVGKDKMESLYMKSDLNGLIEELKNYSHPADIKDFIIYLDYLIKNIYKKELTKEQIKELSKMALYVNKYIIITYLNSIDYYGINNEEEYNDFVDTIQNFLAYSISSIPCEGGKIECSILNDKKFLKTLRKSLKEYNMDFKLTK